MFRKLIAGLAVIAFPLWTAMASAGNNAPPAILVDINSASLAQMAALGIDMASAGKIVNGRLWASKERIKGKAVSEADYAKIAGKITASQPKLIMRK